MSGFDHIVLCVFLYLLFYLYDRSLIKKRKDSIIYKKLCIIFFVFVEGLRYGRGRDFFHYGESYLHYAIEKSNQPLYQFFQSVLHEFDFTLSFLPYGALFIVLSLLFILCFFKFSELFKDKVCCFCLLGILATQYIFEWTIRQGLSFALLLLAWFYFENRQWKKALIYMLIGFFMHYGNAFFLLLMFFCYFFLSNKPVSIKISLPLLVIVTFVLNADNFLPYVQILISSLNVNFLGEGFSHYVTNSSRWFSDASILEDMRRGLTTTIITTLFYASTIIIGYYNHKTSNKWTYIYNAYVLSLLIYVPFYLVELVSRIFFPATVLWFIPVALCLYNIPVRKSPFLLRCSYIVLILYLFAYYGRFVFFNPIGSYIWSQQPQSNYL